MSLTLTNEWVWGFSFARTDPQLVIFLGALGNKKDYAPQQSSTVLKEHIFLAFLCFEKERIRASINAILSMMVAAIFELTALVDLFPSQSPIDHSQILVIF